jgi:hypothetical protein
MVVMMMQGLQARTTVEIDADSRAVDLQLRELAKRNVRWGMTSLPVARGVRPRNVCRGTVNACNTTFGNVPCCWK